MLFYYLYLVKDLCIGVLIISLLVATCAGYAYVVDSQRSEDDPEKRHYRPGAWLLTIFTWPVLLPVILSLFLLRVLVYGLFLIVFISLLILLPRETREPTWMENKILKIGDMLLKANSFLIRMMLRPWTTEPEMI